eukprot:TRINITY_DN2970_c0_g1_i1.p1 TRINITY_DN2970_c0_g1~~TRINITY_DN2970_c0_g1_i1.p1  ORF type:complete len:133 (+),score=20.21 TRINITY_DN2970_c0_g1_i1:209-607(+)
MTINAIQRRTAPTYPQFKYQPISADHLWVIELEVSSPKKLLQGPWVAHAVSGGSLFFSFVSPRIEIGKPTAKIMRAPPPTSIASIVVPITQPADNFLLKPYIAYKIWETKNTAIEEPNKPRVPFQIPACLLQ